MIKTISALISAVVTIYLLKWYLCKRRVVAVRDKVAVITGATSGIGEACAHVFYNAGAQVVLCSRRTDQLERVKKALTASKAVNAHEPGIRRLDVTEIVSIPALIHEIESKYGRIDILINNAGVSSRGSAIDTAVDLDKRIMDVNYFGQIAMIKAALPSMLKRKAGHIVVMSSVQGRIAIPFRSSYAASKHALQAFCDTLRAELHDSGVHVSVLAPGYVRTALSHNAVTSSGEKYGMMDSTTAGGMAPETCAMRVLECVECARDELVLCHFTAMLAIYIRCLWPSLYFWIMKKRARKELKKL